MWKVHQIGESTVKGGFKKGIWYRLLVTLGIRDRLTSTMAAWGKSTLMAAAWTLWRCKQVPKYFRKAWDLIMLAGCMLGDFTKNSSLYVIYGLLYSKSQIIYLATFNVKSNILLNSKFQIIYPTVFQISNQISQDILHLIFYQL